MNIKSLHSIRLLTTNRPLLKVQTSGSVIVPPEIQTLRVRARNLAGSKVVREVLLQDGGVLSQRARVARTRLALVERHDCLVENQTHVGSLLGHGGGVAAETLDGEVASLGNDVAGGVGVSERDVVQRKVLVGNEDAEGGDDWGDVGVVGTGIVSILVSWKGHNGCREAYKLKKRGPAFLGPWLRRVRLALT